MKKILLIEDNQDVRENTAEILELAAYQVLTADNGKTGVAIAQQEKPDLIICDIMMPILDGYGVLHLLSKNTETASIPFIFLTAKAERSDLRKGMDMGADDYITKPFDDIELLNAVESRLRKMAMVKADIAPTQDGVNSLLRSAKNMESLKELSAKQQVKSFKKKEVIFTEGDTAHSLYLLNRGKVKIYKSHEIGKDFITRLLQPGDFFGFLPLLENSDHTSSAEALEDCEVTIFPKEDFYVLLEQSPAVMQQFIKLLSGNLAEEQEELLKLAYSSVRKRTADALIKLKDRYQGNDKEFSMAIAREDLAKMVGTATESLIRTLSDFREEGLIRIDGSTISILQAEKLAHMRN
jgi:CRP-like cAMP-binding protein/CheY-like chemotaxis protein